MCECLIAYVTGCMCTASLLPRLSACSRCTCRVSIQQTVYCYHHHYYYYYYHLYYCYYYYYFYYYYY